MLKTTKTKPAKTNFVAEQILERLGRATTDTFIAVAVVVAGSLALAVEASADPVRVANLGSYSSLNLRTAPTTQANVITRMPNGAANIEWTGNQITNGATQWYEVVYQGQVGWAAARYLEPAYGYGSSTGAAAVTVISNDYVPDYDYNYGYNGGSTYVTTPTYVPTTTTGYTTSSYGTGYGSQSITGDEVGAALFGLVVGGILGAVIAGEDGGGSTTTVVHPAPTPTPAPQPARRQLSCSGDGVSFTYLRSTGDVSINFGGARTFSGTATDRAQAAANNFAIPFNAGRGDGVLVVENIRAGGNNASIYWNGVRRQGLYNVHCQRNRV